MKVCVKVSSDKSLRLRDSRDTSQNPKNIRSGKSFGHLTQRFTEKRAKLAKENFGFWIFSNYYIYTIRLFLFIYFFTLFLYLFQSYPRLSTFSYTPRKLRPLDKTIDILKLSFEFYDNDRDSPQVSNHATIARPVKGFVYFYSKQEQRRQERIR